MKNTMDDTTGFAPAKEEWATFECEECGEVEDIDIGTDAGEQICGCGGLMVRSPWQFQSNRR